MNLLSTQSIPINNYFDVADARRQVRDIARSLGMSLADQSRISLATSSLAGALGLGEPGPSNGIITIGLIHNDHKQGVKVSCQRNDCEGFCPPPSYFGNERGMVDELVVTQLPSDAVEVTITKWMDL